jgi:hypothetical protein
LEQWIAAILDKEAEQTLLDSVEQALLDSIE